MPRIGFGSADATEGRAGIQAGNYEIVDAYSKIHQFPLSKKPGAVQSAPFACVQLDFAPLDENGNRKKDEEPISEYLRIGDIKDWHPGVIDEADKDNLEAEIEDQGDEVDVKGNTIFSVDPAGRLWKKISWMLFTSSLEEKGFKAEILGRGYIPDLIGTKLELYTETRKWEKDGKSGTGTDLLVKHIIERPYEKKAGSGPKGKAAGVVASKGKAGAGAGVGATAGAGATTAAADTTEDEDNHATAVGIITAVSAANEGKKITRTEFQRQVLSACMKAKEPKIQPKIQARIINMVKDDTTLQELFIEAGLAIEVEGDKIQF